MVLLLVCYSGLCCIMLFRGLVFVFVVAAGYLFWMCLWLIVVWHGGGWCLWFGRLRGLFIVATWCAGCLWFVGCRSTRRLFVLIFVLMGLLR